jgi:hypothetical protein
MVPATGSIHLGDCRVDRHLIIQNTHSIFPSYSSHTLLRNFLEPPNLCCSLWPGTPSYPVTHFLHSSNKNQCFLMTSLRILLELHWFITPCWYEQGDVLAGNDRVNLEMYFEAAIWWTQICACRVRLTEFGNELEGHYRADSEMPLDAEIARTQRCIWRPWLFEFGHILQGCHQASLAIHSRVVS